MSKSQREKSTHKADSDHHALWVCVEESSSLREGAVAQRPTLNPDRAWEKSFAKLPELLRKCSCVPETRVNYKK